MRRVMAVLFVAAVLVGCTSGDDDDDAAPTTSRSSTTVAADDEAFARRYLLAADDVPAGWTSTPPDPDDDAEDEAGREAAVCLGLPDPALVETARAEGSTFELEARNHEVVSDVSVVRTLEDARRGFDALRGPKVATCIRDVLRPFFEDQLALTGARLGGLDAVPLSVPAAGDEAVAFRTRLTIDAPNGTVAVTSDLVFLPVDRAEVSLAFSAVGELFDESLRDRILERYRKRVGL